MAPPRVWVFFYGSFINPEVLSQAGLQPEGIRVARLWGYDIRIGPLANLAPSDQRCVYGILCQATHQELDHLYAQDWVRHYLPFPVQVEGLDGGRQEALCYIAPNPEPGTASADYIDRILKPARQWGFPQWYLDRLEGFRE